MKVCIVLPTYNEAENIELLIKQVFEIHPEFRFVVVDDSSPDGTGLIADELAKENRRITVMHRPKKAGLGTAYVEGFKAALAGDADLIFEMDADFSHGQEYLKDLLDASKRSDLVIGSRYMDGLKVEGWKWPRRLLSKFANIFVRYITVMPIRDSTSGFRCYRRQVLATMDLDSIRSDGYAFQVEMVHSVLARGFSVIEVPFVFRERSQGESKISRHVICEAFWLTLRCRAPLSLILQHLLSSTTHRINLPNKEEVYRRKVW